MQPACSTKPIFTPDDVIQVVAILLIASAAFGKNPPPLRGKIRPAVMKEPAVDNERPLFLPNVRALASGDLGGAVDAVPSSFQTVYDSLPSNDDPRDDTRPR
jgi:hypothetical protein